MTSREHPTATITTPNSTPAKVAVLDRNQWPLSSECARWAVLKAGDRTLTDDQRHALAELETGGFATAAAYRAKEMLRWIRHAPTPQAARWRITRFINHIGLGLDPHRAARSRPKGAPHLLREPRSHPPALDIFPFQRSARRLERHLPGRPVTRARLSRYRHLRHHHLPARGPAARHLQIHLKRRGTHI